MLQETTIAETVSLGIFTLSMLFLTLSIIKHQIPIRALHQLIEAIA